MIFDALEKHGDDMLQCVIDGSGRKVFLLVFKEALDRAKALFVYIRFLVWNRPTSQLFQQRILEVTRR